MNPKNNIYLLLFYEVIFISFLLFFLPSLFLNRIYINNDNENYSYIPLENNLIIEKRFQALHPNLEQILFLFKNPKLKNKQALYIEVNDNSIALNGGSIGDPSWIPFKFPHINKDVTIKIYSPNKEKEGLFVAINKNDNTFVTNSIYKIVGFKNRLILNYKFQINRLKYNIIPVIIYSIIILGLNVFYVKKK